MTDRELMQKVLEKLVFFAHMKSVSEDTMRLIADLRERLAQPELVQFKCTVVDDDHPDGVPLSKWGRHSEHEPFCYHDGRNIVGKEYADHSDVFPLYTSPPASKPLTDDEIYDMYNEPRSDAEMIAFARAIEAAHGINE